MAEPWIPAFAGMTFLDGRKMSTDFSEVRFTNKFIESGKWPADMAQLVDAWLSFAAHSILQSKDRRLASPKELQKVSDYPVLDVDDDAFFWAFQCVYDLSDEYPDLALDFVRQVLEKNPPFLILTLLATAPLEEVLGKHGPMVIERVEAEARRDPKFRHLLGGVWRHGMPDDIWHRVQHLATEKW